LIVEDDNDVREFLKQEQNLVHQEQQLRLIIFM
jgi:hypothetical protein